MAEQITPRVTECSVCGHPADSHTPPGYGICRRWGCRCVGQTTSARDHDDSTPVAPQDHLRVMAGVVRDLWQLADRWACSDDTEPMSSDIHTAISPLLAWEDERGIPHVVDTPVADTTPVEIRQTEAERLRQLFAAETLKIATLIQALHTHGHRNHRAQSHGLDCRGCAALREVSAIDPGSDDRSATPPCGRDYPHLGHWYPIDDSPLGRRWCVGATPAPAADTETEANRG